MGLDLSKIVSCRNPKKVENKNGREVLAPCRQCIECLTKKMSRYTSLCCQESAESKYTYFVTLTYDNSHLPHCRIYNDNVPTPHLSFVDFTPHNFDPQTLFKFYIKNKNDSDDFSKQYQLFNRESKIFAPKPYKWIPILRKKDVQLFLKRIRYHIAKEFDQSIRYFCVGEYGSQTFRPHYHLLLFFDEPQLPRRIKDIISKCWQYGRIDSQPAKSESGVAYYCSSYVSSFTHVPDLLKNNNLSPFVLHSTNFGTKTNKYVKEFIYETSRYNFQPFDVDTPFGVRSISLSGYTALDLFPRCYNYDNQNKENLYRLYTFFKKCQYQYQTNKLSLIADILFYHSYNDKYRNDLFRSLDIPLEIEFSYSDELKQTHYNRLYHALSVSKNFLNNCAISSLTEEEMISKIDDFYYQRSQWQLSQLYQLQDMYVRFYHNYDNIDNIENSLDIIDDSLDIFYPLNYDSYGEDLSMLYKENTFTNMVLQHNKYLFSQKTKNKKLSNLN